jgi:hypothetical protein
VRTSGAPPVTGAGRLGVPPAGGQGFGGHRFGGHRFGGGSGRYGGGSTAGTTATGAQQVGVVDIASVLGVVGTDPSADVAVLHLDGGSGLATAALSTSPAAVGEAVTAVGNTGGTGTLSVANGTVTALGHRKGEWAGRRVHCRGDSSPERGQRDGDATSRVPVPGTAVRRPAGQPTSIRTRAQELLS